MAICGSRIFLARLGGSPRVAQSLNLQFLLVAVTLMVSPPAPMGISGSQKRMGIRSGRSPRVAQSPNFRFQVAIVDLAILLLVQMVISGLSKQMRTISGGSICLKCKS